jgi:hypothetical protein
VNPLSAFFELIAGGRESNYLIRQRRKLRKRVYTGISGEEDPDAESRHPIGPGQGSQVRRK